MTLYFYKYNNYYNRMAKYGGPSLLTYEDQGELLATMEGINFNPNDNIRTKQILNYRPGPEDRSPDYLIVADGNTIVSRWFVMEMVRTRGGQYETTLLRDVISDWYEDIVEAPLFVEKATVAKNDPAIFNSENMTFNQIKTAEYPIKDKTGVAWMVGYFTKDTIPVAQRTISVPPLDTTIAGTYTNMEEFPYKSLVAYPDDETFRVDIDYTGGSRFCVGWDKNADLKTPNVDVVPLGTVGFAKPSNSTISGITSGYANKVQSALDAETSFVWGSGLDSYLNCNTLSYTREFLRANGNVYKIGDKYYKFFAVSESSERIKTVLAAGSNLANQMSYIMQRADAIYDTIKDKSVEWTRYQYTHMLEEVSVNSIEFTMSDNPVQCDDAPYNMFMVPYHRWLRDDAEGLYTDPVACRRFVETLQTKLTSGNLYDLQLLPYCPLPDNYFLPNGGLRADKFPTEGRVWYQDFSAGNAYVGTIFYCSSATFSKSITDAWAAPKTATEMKISNECDLYRLCSPNYNGQFEFSLAKNGGIRQWNIDCTYRPYTPYIHVAPDFGGLYGQDFDDARGLICGGDFSLAQISNKWEEYQVQNKNYQNIFDRQIQNMEVQQKYQRIQDIANIFTGSAQGGVTAGIASGGNPYAAAGGALLTAAAGVVDAGMNEALRYEALDYTKDQFGYQLGNIQAMPYSLTKVSAYNANNKIFPFLEYYTCTDVEKQALRNKIRYNGMSVGRIGTISEFKQAAPTYIKGKLIRCETIADDTHVLNAIAEELNKGVFI